ncbi:LysR substrate-binding domain-containing protein [Pseudomonas aeruginosa]
MTPLLRERNVSRAAETPGAEPAGSEQCAEPPARAARRPSLLVRAGRAMQPTPRALALEAPIRAALRQIEQSLGDGEGFDPGRSRQRFTVAVTDYVELICMPALMRRLSERAPGISIAIQHPDPDLAGRGAGQGELDLVLGRFENVPARFQRRHWASETLQLVARRQHAAGAGSRPGHLPELQHLWVRRADQGDGRPVAGQPGAQAAKWPTPRRTTCGSAHRRVQRPGRRPAATTGALLERLLPLQSFDLPIDLGPFHLDTGVSAAHARTRHRPCNGWSNRSARSGPPDRTRGIRAVRSGRE